MFHRNSAMRGTNFTLFNYYLVCNNFEKKVLKDILFVVIDLVLD